MKSEIQATIFVLIKCLFTSDEKQESEHLRHYFPLRNHGLIYQRISRRMIVHIKKDTVQL